MWQECHTRVGGWSSHATLHRLNFTKNLKRVHCWSTLCAINRRDASFRRTFEKRHFRPTRMWLKETRRQRSEEQESESPLFTLVEKPRCQTLKSRVRSAALRSCLRNGNKSITGNGT